MIEVKVDNCERMPVVELEPFQRELKTLSEESYAQLRDSIKTEGFVAPIFVWENKSLFGGDICPVSAAGICPVSTADICPDSIESQEKTGWLPAAVRQLFCLLLRQDRCPLLRQARCLLLR